MTGCSYEERVTPNLIELHWLLIEARIMYKVCIQTYIALKMNQPTYLAEKMTPSRNRLLSLGQENLWKGDISILCFIFVQHAPKLFKINPRNQNTTFTVDQYYRRKRLVNVLTNSIVHFENMLT